MSLDGSQRLQEILAVARHLPPNEIDAFLRSECRGDAALYAKLCSKIEEEILTTTVDEPLDGEFRRGNAALVFTPGQLVSGRYRILRFLSRGGMGEVYEAEDLELREHVALKTLLPRISADSSSIARFKQEIQLSRKVAHPNVCRVYDLARDPTDGSPADAVVFLTMEFLPGETLEARLRREGRMSAEEALPLVEQLAAALDAAHDTRIIHRDFKPANVMLVPGNEGPRAVVTDFGLARTDALGEVSAGTKTLTGRVMGTPDFMAPELLRGSAATCLSDVYAFGMTVYRMLIGRVPLQPGGALPPPRSVIPELDVKWEQAILRALHPDPEQRFSRAGQFLQAVRGEPVTNTTISAKHRRSLVAAAVAVLALGGAWYAWGAWSRWRVRPSAEAVQLYRKGTQDLYAASYFAATKALDQAVQIAPHFGLAHARLAEAWVDLEVPEKAGMEMLLARRENTSALSALDRLQLDAIDLSITREFPAAARKYEEMLKMGADKGDIYLDLGRTYEKAGQQPKESEYYGLAAKHSPRNPAAWLRLAAMHSQESKWAQAADEFRKAEELYLVMSNLEGLTEVAYQRGVDANRRGQLQEGAAQANKALETARVTGNLHQEIRAKLQLGSNAYLSGDAAVAERYALEAVNTARLNHIESLTIRGVLVLGNAYRRKGDSQGAEKYYLEARDLALRNNSGRLTALALLSLAALHGELNRSGEAFNEAREALKFFQSNHFARESCQCLTIVGRTQQDRGDPAAHDSFSQCLKIAEQAQDAFQMTLAHESLGNLLGAQERFPEALMHHKKELELSTDVQHSGFGAYHCADTLWALGRYAEADSMFEKASASGGKFPSLRLSISVSQADMALSQRRFAKAAAISRAALAASPGPVDAAQLTRILGSAELGSGLRQQGRRDCESALSAARKLGDQSLLLNAQLAAAEARLETGDAAGALSLIREAEPVLANLPHSHWLALVLAARADPSERTHAAAAKHQLDELARQWGDSVFKVYLARPDVDERVRWLSRVAPANH